MFGLDMYDFIGGGMMILSGTAWVIMVIQSKSVKG
jgi:hypothetical protein